MGKGNLSKRKGLLSEITHDMLDYIAEKIRGHIETKVIDKAALENEKTQRETADDALRMRISEEEEARETADTELELRIINAESGIGVVRDELKADIKAEADERNTMGNALLASISGERSAREDADNNLQRELSKKVSAEDGKGLSKISGIFIRNQKLDEISDYYDITIWENDADETSNTYDFFDTTQTIKRLNLKANKSDLSDYYTKSEIEAYIEETLLGGAW